VSDEVLIIEDDPELSEIFMEIVRGSGLRCANIRNGRDALEYLQSHAASVVILDLNLPEVSGQKLLEFIRQNSQHKDTKILVLSADANRAQVLESVADLVLIKPASVDQISEFTLRLMASHGTTADAAEVNAIDSPRGGD
jgi:DNA-binding response OmpR family regulator